MARYAGPKCRLCRREGMKLYLKGARCESEKCGIVRRKQTPGQHGVSRRRPSDYALQMREKQKAKRIYGVLEKQFKNYVTKALKQKEVTGEVLMQTLESRLDSVLYRAGFTASRPQARQFIRFGYFAVNGKVVNTTSYQVVPGDRITVVMKERVSVRDVANIPAWLNVSKENLSIDMSDLPKSEELKNITSDVNPQLIVEYYSR